MATAYTVIIPLIRAAIGDYGIRDASAVIIQFSEDFHDTDIGKAIDLALLQFTAYSGDGTQITPSIADDLDKGAIVYYVALVLALPAGTWSLEAPNMKYWNQENANLIAFLYGMTKYFIDRGSAEPEIWGALDVAYNENKLVADRITEAIGAY